MSKVTVKAAFKTGKVVNANVKPAAAGKAQWGWIAIQSETTSYVGGVPFKNVRTGFMRQELSILENWNMVKEFQVLNELGVDTTGIIIKQPVGFAAGQELPGRIVVKDQLEPLVAENPAFGVRIPQSGSTAEIRSTVREACTKAGVVYMQSGLPIYRRTYYSPYPAGHPQFEADVILSADNQDDITKFIATLNLTAKANAGMGQVSDSATRIAALKAIPKAKRTAEEKEELAELMELQEA